MGRGAAKMEGEHVNFTPTKRGVREKVLAMLKGVRKKCPHFKSGVEKFHPSFWGGGGRKKFRTHDFPFM